MSPEKKIEQLVHDFVSKVTGLAREAAMATLTAHFGPGAEPAARQTTARAAKASSPERTRRPKRGAKRPAADISQLEGVLAKHIEAHPGQRVEQINKVLGTRTNDVRLPLAKLIEAGEVRTKGSRRATQYFPA